MSRIDDLLGELAPHGVQFKKLGHIARLVRGNGMPKSDLTTEGVGAIHYGQIYTKYGTSAETTISHVSHAAATRLAKVDHGNIIITNTSENLADVGKAVAWLGRDSIVTGGHATVIKHQQDPRYLAYWFQTEAFAVQKRALASGTKVIDVSARQLEKVIVPVPPLEVQREIVRVLDQFSQLEAELKGRMRQYSFYRDHLLAPASGAGLRLGDISQIFGGLTGKTKADFVDGNAAFVSYTNVFSNIEVRMDLTDRVRVGPAERQRSLQRGDILFTGSSENAEEVATSSVVTSETIVPTYLNSFSIGVRLADPDLLHPDYAKHLFRSEGMRRQLKRTASGVTRFNVSKARLADVRISPPGYAEQQHLASLLDNFWLYTTDLSHGLPEELAARRKQYEYYRDKLLTFEEAPA